MQKHLYTINIALLLSLFVGSRSFCQDSQAVAVHAESTKWKVKLHKGMFGLAKPQFGPYTTVEVAKIDSPVTRRKTNLGSEAKAEISSGAVGIDVIKLQTIEKTKHYKLILSTETNNVEAIFSIASISNEEKQTFLGKLLSKEDEGKDKILSYNRDVVGVIATGEDSLHWEFFLDDYGSAPRQGSSSISNASFKSEKDSLLLKLYFIDDADMAVYNAPGEVLAKLQYRSKPSYVWIKEQVDPGYKKAIAALFAVIMSIRDL